MGEYTLVLICISATIVFGVFVVNYDWNVLTPQEDGKIDKQSCHDLKVRINDPYQEFRKEYAQHVYSQRCI